MQRISGLEAPSRVAHTSHHHQYPRSGRGLGPDVGVGGLVALVELALGIGRPGSFVQLEPELKSSLQIRWDFTRLDSSVRSHTTNMELSGPGFMSNHSPFSCNLKEFGRPVQVEHP